MEQVKQYIVEVNDDIYLKVSEDNKKSVIKHYNFTDSIKKATKFDKLEFADLYARKCGGNVRNHTITYEVEKWST